MKVLVVDDQRSARRVLKQMLGDLQGVEIFEAGRFEEAMAVVDAAVPDLLLLDIRLSDDPRDRDPEVRARIDTVVEVTSHVGDDRERVPGKL